MKKNKLSFIQVLIVLILTLLLSFTNSPSVSKKLKLNIIFSDSLLTDNGYTLHVVIYQDNFRNITINLFSENSYLSGAGGSGNSELIKNNPKIINKIQLDSDSIPEYYIGTYTYGSTFGAMSYFIIWYHDHSWEITKTPFLRPFFEDANNDGIYEIVEYFNSSEGKQYQFIKGNFDPVTK